MPADDSHGLPYHHQDKWTPTFQCRRAPLCGEHRVLCPGSCQGFTYILCPSVLQRQRTEEHGGGGREGGGGGGVRPRVVFWGWTPLCDCDCQRAPEVMACSLQRGMHAQKTAP